MISVFRVHLCPIPKERLMQTPSIRLAIWIFLGQAALLLAACGPAGGDASALVGEAEFVAEEAASVAPEAEPTSKLTVMDEPLTTTDEPLTTTDEPPTATDEPPTPTEEPEATPEPTEEPAENTEPDEDEAAAATPNAAGLFTNDDRSERQRVISVDWNTDWNRHTVPYDELLALLPVRDGIPAIDNPQYVTPEEASSFLAENDPVIAFENNGDARAYPLQIMTYHEIVNDVVGDLPVTVTFCPLCNSAIVFDRTLSGDGPDDVVLDFGTSGWLRHSDLVMYDRQTESLWQQFTGEGLVGELAGAQLTFLPSSMVGFANFREAYPDGLVLSQDTGFQRPYGQNPYPGYDTIGQDPFAFIGVPDGRLAAMERVIAVSLDGLDVAYPLTAVAEAGVINDTQGGQDLVIFHVGGTSSALDAPIIFLGADVGATGVFDPNVNGEKLTFVKEDDIISDEQTGSTWNVLGQATDGPLVGESLSPIIHGDHFWFAWAAFQPETVIFGS
jgi:hypothetical protein